MVAETNDLSRLDLQRLGKLHVESIGDSLPALLGERFAVRLYDFLVTSEQEQLFVERVGDRVESCCVLSFAPESLHGRIARGTLPVLAQQALLAARRKDFRAYLKGAVQDALHGHAGQQLCPEITYIFTDEAVRGLGLSSRLIERVDEFLRECEIETYYVKTIDDPANLALSFYLDNDFVPIATRVEAGRRYVEFEKKLAIAARVA